MKQFDVIIPDIFRNFNEKEREYFFSIARSHPEEMLLHQNQGKLWEKDEFGKDWSNVTEHCLMEAARAQAFARLLELPGDIKEALVSAALVHDFNKKDEIRLTKEDILNGGTGRKCLEITEDKFNRTLRDVGFSELVISLAGHVSPQPDNAVFIKEKIDSPNPSISDIAHFVAHYIDSYTRKSEWAQPVEHQGERFINDIDRRAAANAANPDYKKIDQEGPFLFGKHPFFEGKTIFESMAELNHLIEQKLHGILKEKGIDIQGPLKLPEFVDAAIKEEIYK